MKLTYDREALSRVVAMINVKGGTGKTTLTANIAGLLAKGGQRVLAVDLDPQGSLGLDLGYAGSAVDDDGAALAAGLLFGQQVAPVPDVRENLDVLVGGDALNQAQSGLAAQTGKHAHEPALALARVLSSLAEAYDLVLIDCPPGGDVLQRAALGAAHWVIVPSRADVGSQKGLQDVAARLQDVLPVNPDIDLLGVALFDVDTGARRVRENARAMVNDALGREDAVFETVVRHSAAVAQEVRRRRVLVHELEASVKSGPSWWQVRRGDAAAAGPRTAASVSDDLHGLTGEIVARIGAMENEAVPA